MDNEQGSTLILALILISVLTILGLTSINTTNTEYQIVRNERIYQDNFYRAESAVAESVRTIETTSWSTLEDRSFPLDWLKKYNEGTDMGDIQIWTDTNSAGASVSDSDYSVVETGIATGGSLDMTATSNLYDYVARGWGHSDDGHALIEVGIRKRH